jgi:hypothetical protein
MSDAGSDQESIAAIRAEPDTAFEEEIAGRRRRDSLLYGMAILVGAFLLFQVQLIIGKYALPWFGGGPAVWTACILVFQVLLLGGYGYAHLLSMRLTLRTQARVHLLLLGISVALLAGLAFFWPSPITPGGGWKPTGGSQPVWQIVRLLLAGVGTPFFFLATTSPLLQQWFARTQGRSPYRLYALSNIGSLLGLLTYPFLLEPNVSLHRQAWLWSSCYVLYVLICAACALRARRGSESAPVAAQITAEGPRPGLGLHLLWMSLAACACMMFLATTNMLCQEIAVIPFLWVLPLSLYLLTFIACFDSSRWYCRALFHPLYFVALLLVLVTGNTRILPQIGSYSLALLVVAMICHGELVRLKPSARYLTSFYLMIAAGGAIGGAFVALVAPLIFPAFWEFQLAGWGCGVLLVVALFLDRNSWFYRGRSWLPLAMALGTAAAVEVAVILLPSLEAFLPPKNYLLGVLGAATLLALWPAVKRSSELLRSRCVQVYALAVLALVGGACAMQARSQVHDSVARFRSFFGIFRISESEDGWMLLHGQTIHGWQLHDPDLQALPTTYYAMDTGIGILLRHLMRPSTDPGSGLRMGVVGLGTGTLAAYGHRQDYFRFYEIDPAIKKISYGPGATFTFLNKTVARVDVVLGDARVSLEREADAGDFQKFDVLVLDAFSSDSVPVHLLTKEATQLYLRHLRGPKSVIAFHITNRILDLGPVMRGLSRELHLNLAIVRTYDGTVSYACRWAFLSQDPSALYFPEMEQAIEPVLSDERVVSWTDDYSDLFSLVKKPAWW